MGYGYTVRYECSLSVDEGEVSEMPWYHDENQLTKDSRRTIEMVKVSAGTYRSYLDINHLYEGDIGWYSCSAQVTFNDATLARVVPDRVYLALTGKLPRGKVASWKRTSLGVGAEANRR